MKMRIAIGALAISGAGLVALLNHEGYTGAAVIPVPGDVPTVGFGTTTRADGSPVQMGDTTTPVAAVNVALRDVTKFEGALKECVKVPLTQGEYDVYVQHAYNIGARAFCFNSYGGPGVIPARLNAGNYRGACDALLLYRRAAGHDCSAPENARICGGLWKRRLESHAACLGAQP